MQSVVARLLQPSWLLVGMALVLVLLAALALASWVGGLSDTDQFVGPFRWITDEPVA